MTPVHLILRWLVVLWSAALCVSCSSERPTYELAGSTMGTTFSVQVVNPEASIDADTLKTEIQATLDAIENAMSTYRSDSELSRFNAMASTDWFEVSAGLCSVIEQAQALSELSGGAFDITVSPLVNLWGFGSGEPISEPPDPERIEALFNVVGSDKLHADCMRPAIRKDVTGLQVDLSAYAKGYGVDQVAALLDRHGVADFLVEIGGEIRARGRNARETLWAIGVESPHRDSRTVARVVPLNDAAMATSGDYRIYFENAGAYFSHMIDPRSGYPVSHNAAAVTVVADTAAYADGLATALLVLGPAEGLSLAERQDVAVLFQLRIDDAIEERMSSRFARELAAE